MKSRSSGRRWLPRPRLGWLVPALALLVAIAAYLADPVPLQALRNAVFDQYQRWDASPYREASVRIIDIDEESLARLGQWPWPRFRLAELVETLAAAGAASIVFDVLFTEPDRTSPAAMLETWGSRPELGELLGDLPDHDRILADAVAHHPVVLGHSLQHGGAPAESLEHPFVIAERGGSPLPFLHSFSNTLAPIRPLQEAASGLGAINFIPDSDGVVRKVPLLLRMGDDVVPSLIAEALRVAQGRQYHMAITSRDTGAGIEAVQIGSAPIPTTRNGEIWVRFVTGASARTIPAWQMLEGEIGPGDLQGSIVLVGASAQGLHDLRFTPLGEVIPGVEIHAQALEQILLGDTLTRPNWAPGAEMLTILTLGLLMGLLSLSLPALTSALLFALVLSGLVWTGWYSFSQHALLFDPVSPAMALLLAFLGSSVHRHFTTERQQRWVKQAFARYVSPNLVEHIVRNPDELELGGMRRECSFIFTDLAGFTSLMETLDPGVAVKMLNEYLDNLIRIAFDHDATLDRIVGDAVALMFSAPVEQTDHRQRALRCAEDIHRFAVEYSLSAHAQGIPFGLTRIGIHSGPVTVGNFGGSAMFDYRALGDPVNTAARLESVNRHLGTTVCASESMFESDPDMSARPIGRLILKGKTQPLMVYEPGFARETATSAPLEAYLSAYAHVRAGAIDAIGDFAKLATRYPHDGLVQYQLKRLIRGSVTDLIELSEK